MIHGSVIRSRRATIIRLKGDCDSSRHGGSAIGVGIMGGDCCADRNIGPLPDSYLMSGTKKKTSGMHRLFPRSS